MNRSRSGWAVVGIACGCLMAFNRPSHAQVIDNFESYALGGLPSPTWLDVGAVLPGGRVPPFPSGVVVSTLDAHGNPTKAVTTVGDLATSKGIYASVPVSNFYSLHADVRVDRFSDQPDTPAADWAIQLTFGQNGVDNWAYTPQAGVYASALTGGWRLYVTTASASADIDLGVAATVGTWYSVSQSLDATLGIFHSQIFDAATGSLLVDQFNTIPGWLQSDALFDSFAFFGGETAPDDTVGDIGVVDNVNIEATSTPEPATFVLIASGLMGLAVVRRRVR